MKRVLLGLLMALSLACHRPATVREHVNASLVRLTYDSGQICSGFVVKTGVILTAAHCVEDVVYVDGKKAKAIIHDDYYDLATYAVDTGGKPALQLRPDPVIIGEDVLATGYALGFDHSVTTSNRVLIVSQKAPMGYARGIIYEGLFVPGMSGGPVVDLDGLVVGMVQQSRLGIQYGVPSVLIRGFLVDSGVE